MKVIVIYLAFLSGGPTADGQSPAAIPVNKHKFIVIAHRGDHTQAPENTIQAFENGIANGVDYVEADLRTTKDSVLIIMHDATVDRMTDGNGKISSLDYSQISQLRVFDKIKASAKKYPIPTFEDLLKTCRGKVYIYLDFKDASVEQAYTMIKKYDMQGEVIVYINSLPQYTNWKKIAPSIPLMLSLPDSLRSVEELSKFLSDTPVALLDGDYSNYTPALLKTARQLGVEVWPDIQGAGEPANWDDAMKIGFQGLQTDHPKALIAYLIKKGAR